MINLKQATSLVAFLFFILSLTSAQTTEKVILYNSQPVKVGLSDKGEIQSFIGVVPGYMAGFELSTKEEVKVNPKVVEKPILPPSTQNAAYKVVSTEKEELEYQPNFAILDKATIDKLNVISAKLTADPNAKILLTAHTVSKEKDKLAANRLASAIAYLGLKGINPSRIQSETQQNAAQVDIVMVNYLN